MFDTVVTVVMVMASLVCLYPLLFVISCSVSDTSAVLANKVILWPVGFSVEMYKLILKDPSFWIGFRNSTFYVVVSCLLTLVNTVSVAYPLTRPNLKGRKLLTLYLLITMYFSGGMIPSFIVVSKLGLYNTVWALLLPCYSAYNIILCRTFMASLGNELVDSAFIDGANQFQTLIRIVLPLCKPVLAVIMIYTIVGVWNSWLGAQIYTTKQNIQPLQIYLQRIINQTNLLNMSGDLMKNLPIEVRQYYAKMQLSAKQIRYAAIVLVSLPILMVYPMFQKHFAKGVMLGSLKG